MKGIEDGAFCLADCSGHPESSVTKPFAYGIDRWHARRSVPLDYERGDATGVAGGMRRVTGGVELECECYGEGVTGSRRFDLFYLVRRVSEPGTAVPDDTAVGCLGHDGQSRTFRVPSHQVRVTPDVDRTEDYGINAIQKGLVVVPRLGAHLPGRSVPCAYPTLERGGDGRSWSESVEDRCLHLLRHWAN